MSDIARILCGLTLPALLLSSQAFALTIVELSTEARRPAMNDVVHATLAAEATGATPAELSRQINGLIADALKKAQKYPSVKTQSAGTSTYPVYSKGGEIESWRMRSEVALESGDNAAISELLGTLQLSLGVTSLTLSPSAETRKKVENETLLDAIAAFKERAKVIADALGKPYRIKQLSVHGSGQPVQPMFRAAAKSMMSDAAAPMPMESGETQISVNVSGQIELE